MCFLCKGMLLICNQCCSVATLIGIGNNSIYQKYKHSLEINRINSKPIMHSIQSFSLLRNN